MGTTGLITGRIKDFLNKFPDRWMEKGDFVLQEKSFDGYKNTYLSNVNHPWEIPGIKAPFSGQKIFIDVPHDPKRENNLRIQGSIQGQGNNVIFLGRLSENGALVLSPENETANPISISGVPVAGMNPVVNWITMLPLKVENKLRITFQPLHKEMIVYNNLRFELNEKFCIAGTNLCLSDPYALINTAHSLQNPRVINATAGTIGAELSLGKPVDALVHLSPTDTATLRIRGKGDDGLPGPQDLLKAIGFGQEGKALADSISKTPVLDALFIDQAEIEFNIKSRKFISGTIRGHLKISGYKIRFSARYPNIVLSAHLDPETPIKVMELLKNTFPDLGGIPSDLKVRHAAVRLAASPLNLQLEVVLADVWKMNSGPVSVELEELGLMVQLGKDQPVTGNLRASLKIGGVDFSLAAERIANGKNTGWNFRTNVGLLQPVELKGILADLAKWSGLPAPDWVPSTELSGIVIELNTLKKTFELKARANVKDKLGPFETIAVDLHLKIDKTNKELPFSIKINGELKLEKSLIQFKTDFGNKNWFIEANWEKTKGGKGLELLEFIRVVDRDKKLDLKNVPAAVQKGLTLQKMSFSYRNESQALELAATNELGITLQFALVKAEGVAAILGLKYDNKLNESEIGKSFKAFEKDISFSEAWVVISWIPPGFKAPAKSDFSKGWPVAIDKMGKGVLLSARMNVKDKATGAFELLNRSVPNSTGSFQVTGQLNFSPFGLKLALAYDKDIIFKTDSDYPLILRDCAIEIEAGTSKISIGAKGTLEFYIDEFKVESRLAFEISTQGIQLDSSTKTDKGIPLFGLRNVQLHSVGFTLGIGFAPPAVRLGAEVEMTFRVKQGVKDYFGLILGFTGPIPKPDYVGMDIAKISLNELIENLEENKGKKSFLPDKMAEIKAFSFVWAMRDKTKLPDGSTVNAGVAFHGLLTLNNWNAWFEFMANPTIGISGKGQLEKIDVEGFSVKGKSLDIKRLHYQNGKEWLPVSNADRILPGVKTENHVMLKGGGALIAFSTYKSPYFVAEFDIRILDIVRAKAEIAVTDKGMKCNVQVNIPHLYYLNHNAELREDKSFLSTGDFSAGLDFDLPFSLSLALWKGRIYVGIKGSQKISRGADGKFYFYFSYKYHFLDISFPGPTLEIPYAPKTFRQVTEIIWENFRKNIFGDLYNIIVKRQYPAGGGRIIKSLSTDAVIKRKGFQPVKPRSLVKSNLTWIDEALQDTKKSAPRLLKMSASSPRVNNFLAKAQKQTDAELREMKEVLEVIDSGHHAMIGAGEKKLRRDIANANREIEDLKDQNHGLENKIRDIWNKNLGNYRKQKFVHFDAESDFYHHLISAKKRNEEKIKQERIESRIENAISKISEKPDPENGYKKRKGKWADIAVNYHAGVVKMEVDAELEKEYLLQQQLKQKSTAFLKNRSHEATLII